MTRSSHSDLGEEARTPERRERFRLQAAGRFDDGQSTRGIAGELRVHERTVARWRGAWLEGSVEALRSKGPGWSVQVSVQRALERDEQAIATWRKEVWPAVKPSRHDGPS
jgi:hypothetical protein